MVIYLENQGVREEVTRVAFERANSTHPEVEFKDQLRAEVSKAHDAVAALREMLSDAGTLA
jgi:hypothetical protein